MYRFYYSPPSCQECLPAARVPGGVAGLQPGGGLGPDGAGAEGQPHLPAPAQRQGAAGDLRLKTDAMENDIYSPAQ